MHIAEQVSNLISEVFGSTICQLGEFLNIGKLHDHFS